MKIDNSLIKKYRLTIGATLIAASVFACNSNIDEEIKETENGCEAASEISSNAVTEATAEPATAHQYIAPRDGDSYYSILEDGISIEVRAQRGGTCWTNAAASSMEANYIRKYGIAPILDPNDMVLSIYDPDKEEGWFVSGNYMDIGGWNWLVAESISNGYDGYVLEYARNLGEECDIDRMKECLVKYGPIVVATNDNSGRKANIDGYMTFNAPYDDDFDHAVLIIGWDDNFPADYFHINAKENGAWLCQNSKGAGWGENGTYWVSYENPFSERTAFAITSDYSEVATYDYGNENRIETGEETVIANVFHKEGLLAAVGTFTGGDNQEYTIEVYDENMENLLSTVDACMDINGYQIVELPEPIEVSDYAIVIRFKGSAPVEGESFSIEDIRAEFRATCEEGQSFVLIDGQWEDLADEATAKKLGIDFVPNNACIKGLYIEN